MANTIKKQLKISILATDAATQTLKKIKAEIDKTLGGAGAKAKTEMSKVNQAFKTLKLTPFTEATAKIKELEGAYKTLVTSGKVSTQQLAQANLKLKVRTAQLSKTTTGLTGAFMAMRTHLLTLAASFYVIYRAISKAVGEFKKFDDAMRTVGAVSQATGKEYQKMTDLAMEMGRSTRYTSVEAAEGLKYLSMAGFEAKKSMEALPGVLQLAAAGNLDLGQSADIATNILTGFGMEASELVDVNNAMVYAFTNSNATLLDIAESLKIVAPIVTGVGGKFTETTAAVALLSKAGLKGTLSATGLRGAIGRLMSPTKKESELMAQLAERMGVANLSVRDSEGSFVGFIEIIEQLEEAGFKGDEALELFGLRAGPTMSALLGQGSAALRDFTNQIEMEIEKGTIASEIMERMQAGVGGMVRLYESAKSAFNIKLGKTLWVALEPLVLLLTLFFNLMSKIPVVIMTVGLAFMTAVGGVLMWTVLVPVLSIAMGFLTVTLAGVVAVLSTIAIVFGVILAIVAVLAVGTAVYKYAQAWRTVQEEIKNLKKVQEENSDWAKRDIKSRMQIANMDKKQRKEYEQDIRKQIIYKSRAMEIALKEHGAESAAYKEAHRELLAYSEDIRVLQSIPQNSQAIAARNAAEAFKEAAEITVSTYEDSKKAVVGFYESQAEDIKEIGLKIRADKEDVDFAVRESSRAKFEEMMVNAENYYNEVMFWPEEEKENYLDANAEMKQAVIELKDIRVEALGAWEKAMKKAESIQESMFKNSQKLQKDIRDINQSDMDVSEVWRDNESALYDLQSAMEEAYDGGRIKEALSLSEDMYALGKKQAGEKKEEVDGIEKVFKTRQQGNKKAIEWMKKADKFRREMLEKEKSDQEKNIKRIGEQIDGISKQLSSFADTEYGATIEAVLDSSIFDSAMSEIESRKYMTTVVVNEVRGTSVSDDYAKGGIVGYRSNAILQNFAAGGGVDLFKKRRGHIPGWGNKDDVPAMLTKGEFILTKDAVKNVGTSFLKKLNKKEFPVDLLPRFAFGGMVGLNSIKKSASDFTGAIPQMFKSGGPVRLTDKYTPDPRLLKKVDDLNIMIEELKRRLGNVDLHSDNEVDPLFSSIGNLSLNASSITGSKSPEEAIKSLTGLKSNYQSNANKIISKINGLATSNSTTGDIELAGLLGDERDSILDVSGDVTDILEDIISDLVSRIEDIKEEEEKIMAQFEEDIAEQLAMQEMIERNAQFIENFNKENYNSNFSKGWVAKQFGGNEQHDLTKAIGDSGTKELVKKKSYSWRPGFWYYTSSANGMVDIYDEGNNFVRSQGFPYLTGKVNYDGLPTEVKGSFYDPRLISQAENDKATVATEMERLKTQNGKDIAAIILNRKNAINEESSRVSNAKTANMQGIEIGKSNAMVGIAGERAEFNSDILDSENDRLDVLGDLEDEKIEWERMLEELKIKLQQEKEEKTGYYAKSKKTTGRSSTQYFNSGGIARGEAGVDKIDAKLSAGEAVIKSDVVSRLGEGFFNKLNNNFTLPEIIMNNSAYPKFFADGGTSDGLDVEGSAFRDMGTINLQVGGKSFPIQSKTSQIKDLFKELKKAGAIKS